MIPCSEAVEQLWEYLENEVSDDDRAAVDEHLAFCRRCCGELEFAQEVRGMLASAAEVELPADVENRLTDVLDDLESGDDPIDGEQPTTAGDKETT